VRRRASRVRAAGDSAEEAADPRAIREAALNLLARRDHAVAELDRKLRDRGYQTEAIAAVLAELTTERFLDDERYVERFVSYHLARGQGPTRMRAQLRQLGLSTECINRQLDAVEDWCAHAGVTRRKKFGAKVPKDFRTRAKQARFLEYRGFAAEQIRAALEGGVESEE
jgi:regulatory protein